MHEFEAPTRGRTERRPADAGRGPTRSGTGVDLPSGERDPRVPSARRLVGGDGGPDGRRVRRSAAIPVDAIRRRAEPPIVRRKGGDQDPPVDHGTAIASIGRALRTMRDHRFGSASREAGRLASSATYAKRSASHSKMGLAGLEKAKETAKSFAKTAAKRPQAVTEHSAALAAQAGLVLAEFDAVKASTPARYQVDLVRIGTKAVEALTGALRDDVLQAEPQVQELFGNGDDASRAAIAHGKGRVNELIASGEMETSGFHGTSSPILAGLASGGGELLSMAELNKRSIAQTTGEGDTLSSAAGLKDTISIGIGPEGLGTSAAYAALGMKVTHYNSTLYTYDELVEEIRKLRVLSQVANIKPGNVDLAALQQAASQLGVEAAALGGMMQRITPESAQSLCKRLEDELAIRRKFPKGNPRREGGPTNATTYPILFEFNVDTTTGGVEAEAAGALPGEGFVNTSVPLATTLRRAWCPADRIGELTTALGRILPRTNFEVLPLEALQALPRNPGGGGDALWTTFTKMQSEAAKMETARDLLEHAAH